MLQLNLARTQPALLHILVSPAKHVHDARMRCHVQACRNFVQLCLEGYYDNTIFHRIIKDYLIQGGDPTGTGEGQRSPLTLGMCRGLQHSALPVYSWLPQHVGGGIWRRDSCA